MVMSVAATFESTNFGGVNESPGVPAARAFAIAMSWTSVCRSTVKASPLSAVLSANATESSAVEPNVTFCTVMVWTSSSPGTSAGTACAVKLAMPLSAVPPVLDP